MNAENVLPFTLLLPDFEKERALELYFSKARDDVVERFVQENSSYLENVPMVKVQVSNVPSQVRFKWYYPEEDEPNLLFDYVLNAKSIPINVADLVKARLLGVRLLIEVPKQFGGHAEEWGFVVDVRRTVHMLKPDFLKYPVNKSSRWIPHKKGKVQLVMEIEYINGTKDVVKLLEIEIEWVRYGRLLRELVLEKVIKWTTARRLEKKYPTLTDKHLFAVLRVVVKVKRQKPRQFKVVLPLWTREIAPRELKFGNQIVRVVRGNKVDGYKKVEENVMSYEFEPFNHRVKSWIVKRRANDFNRGYFQLASFDVFRDGDWHAERWILVPRTPTARLILESSHHWYEGLGRVLIQLREGEVVEFIHGRTVILEYRLEDGIEDRKVYKPL